MARIRCAIYCRKSSEDGLEQDFNSLQAQREACAAYIASQQGEGWVLLPTPYDDGGLSGGTLERPALQRLLADIDRSRVDQIVVYKLDRLTRSLADFARLVERLEARGAAFVSVTQSFSTATSMGRLTLNVLLSFAQFEREVTAERIRDKIAASKRKGLWMGGVVPFGYDAEGRTLKPRTDEAAVVREIFALYRDLGTVRLVHAELVRRGVRTRTRTVAGKAAGGGAFSRGHIHQILSNPLYAGRIRHRGSVHPGQHPAIVEPRLWDEVQTALALQAGRRRGSGNGSVPSPFAGKLFDETGDRLTPSHASKGGVRHRYYLSHRLVKGSGAPDPSGWRLPARLLEGAIVDALVAAFGDPALPTRIAADLPAAEIVRLQGVLSALTDQLTAGGALARAAALLQRVTVAPEGLTVRIDASALSVALNLPLDALQAEALVLTREFRLRRRGVETRLVLGDTAPALDRTLIRNIAKAQDWLAAIQRGMTFTGIADETGSSRRRIQHMIQLAFLAPDIVESILRGEQPPGLTSHWLRTHELPACWEAQRRLIGEL